MTEKTVNYTDEMVARLVEVYDPSAEQDARTAQVAELATELGKSTRSVIAKLTTLDLYVPKVYKTKTGAKVVRKAELVTQLAVVLGVDEDVIGSFEKATKTALVKAIGAVGRIKRDAAAGV